MSSLSSTSFNNLFILSSNSPLYLVPATNDAIATDNILLFFKPSGTKSDTILLANSSTMAVFPTPASPINKGLFLVLLDNISIILFISLSLPTTGSISLLILFLFKSTAYSSIISFLLLLFFFAIKLFENSSYSASISTFMPIRILIATPSPSSIIDKNKWSGVTSFSFDSLQSIVAPSIILFKRGVYKNQSFVKVPLPTTLIISSLKVLYVIL